MTKLRTLYLEWDQLGNIVFDVGTTNFDRDAVEEVYALGGAALIDHMLATLSGKNVLDFCVPAIQGLVNTPLEIRPIDPVLRKAALEFHHDKYLFTIFKPKTRLFPDNQKLESALSQMTLNSISVLLRTLSPRHQLALKLRGYSIIASYEEIIRTMLETNESKSSARIKAAQATATFLNKLPKELTEEKLYNLFKESTELIARWKNLPL